MPNKTSKQEQITESFKLRANKQKILGEAYADETKKSVIKALAQLSITNNNSQQHPDNPNPDCRGIFALE